MRRHSDEKDRPQRVFGNLARRSETRGNDQRRILFEVVRKGRIVQLHATKGWRSYRLQTSF